MRLVIACLAVFALGSRIPQTSSDYRARYGAPVLERYSARPDVSVIVTYGADHRACEVAIAPALSNTALVPVVTDPRAFLDPGLTGELLEEIAPANSRGKLVQDWSFQTGAPVHDIQQFDHLSIERNYLACKDCSNKGRPHSVVVFYVRDDCPAPPFSFKKQ